MEEIDQRQNVTICKQRHTNGQVGKSKTMKKLRLIHEKQVKRKEFIEVCTTISRVPEPQKNKRREKSETC